MADQNQQGGKFGSTRKEVAHPGIVLHADNPVHRRVAKVAIRQQHAPAVQVERAERAAEEFAELVKKHEKICKEEHDEEYAQLLRATDDDGPRYVDAYRALHPLRRGRNP